MPGPLDCGIPGALVPGFGNRGRRAADDMVALVERGVRLRAVGPYVAPAALAAFERGACDQARQRVRVAEQTLKRLRIAHQPGVAPQRGPRLVAWRRHPAGPRRCPVA